MQVFVLVNSESGKFTVSLKPEDSLCNGNWHSIFSKQCTPQHFHLYITVLPISKPNTSATEQLGIVYTHTYIYKLKDPIDAQKKNLKVTDEIMP